MSLKTQLQREKLKKKARKGFRGYPVATVAWYGPDSMRASKVVVSIIAFQDAEPGPMETWYSSSGDVRRDPAIQEEIIAFLGPHAVKSVAMLDRIIGCPHEEGINYPLGEMCPECPFWANRDRFSGEVLH